jgi:hypothetical protein
LSSIASMLPVILMYLKHFFMRHSSDDLVRYGRPGRGSVRKPAQPSAKKRNGRATPGKEC